MDYSRNSFPGFSRDPFRDSSGILSETCLEIHWSFTPGLLNGLLPGFFQGFPLGAPSRIPHGIFPGISPRIFPGVFQILDSPREYCLFSKLLRKISPDCSSIFVSVIVQKIHHLHQKFLWKKFSKGFISCLKCSCIYHMQNKTTLLIKVSHYTKVIVDFIITADKHRIG